jgi:hypothetical protein
VSVRQVGGVLLDGQDVALAAVLARIGVAWLQRTNGTVPAEALFLRDQLTEAARKLAAQASGQAGSAEAAAAVGVAESGPAEMTTAQAAAVLGISGRAVRSLCRTGALDAVLSRTGWRIDAGSVTAEAARRKGT